MNVSRRQALPSAWSALGAGLVLLALELTIACATAVPAAPLADWLVPPPFEPIRVVREPELVVEVWGRRYVFEKGPMPARITSQGQDLFLTPPLLLFDERSPEWRVPEVVEATPQAVRLRSESSVGKLRISVDTLIEYDGMVRLDLAVYASSEREMLRSLVYRFELPRRVAEYYNYHLPYDYAFFNVDKEALLEAAGGLGEGVRRLGFVPSVALGNREVGIEWWAETNAHYEGRHARKPLHLEVRGDRVVFEMQPISGTLIIPSGGPWRDTFAFFPAPERPPRADWRSIRYVSQGAHMPSFDRSIGTRYIWVNHSAENPPRWHGLPHGRQVPADHAMRRRLAGLDIGYVPYAKLGMSPNLHPYAMERFEDWTADGRTYRYPSAEELSVFRASGDRWEKGQPYGYAVCMGRGDYVDWMVEESVRAVRDERLDGLYYDHGAITRMCRRSPVLDGTSGREVWEYFQVRRFYKELYERVKAIDPNALIMSHTHGAPRALAAFLDFHLIGESLNGAFTEASHFREVQRDPSLYRPDYLAVTGWLEAQFYPPVGGAVMLLPQIRHGYDPDNPGPTLRHQRGMYAWLLAEGAPSFFANLDVRSGEQVLRAVDRFGSLSGVAVRRWWEGEGAIRASNPSLRVTYYQKPGRVLAVVANWSSRAAETTISIDGAQLGLRKVPRVRDAESTERIRQRGAGGVPLGVPAKDFRLLLIE